MGAGRVKNLFNAIHAFSQDMKVFIDWNFLTINQMSAVQFVNLKVLSSHTQVVRFHLYLRDSFCIFSFGKKMINIIFHDSLSQ